MTTIYDIAKEAKVSIATISRAINAEMRSKVAPDTLNRIEKVIKKHNYTPDFSAKHLTKKSFKTVGVIIPHLPAIFFSDYYSKILSGVSDAVLMSDFSFKMIMFKPGMPKWDDYNFKNCEGIDGLIVTQWPMYFSEAAALEKVRIPSVFITDPARKTKASFMSADNEMGGRIGAEYLLSRGHRKIAVMTGPAWSSDSQIRLKGFKRSMEAAGVGMDSAWILRADYRKDMAAEVTEKFLSANPGATAIFCLNDYMATGVMEKLKQMGIDCPGDISVMGYDDERGSKYMDPPLTTVRVPLFEIARDATTYLLGRLKDNSERKLYIERTLVPVSIEERKSVRDLR